MSTNRIITEDSISTIKNLPIVDVISHYVKLKHSGSSYRANCPFHDEKTPSFQVNPAKNIYKCFGCGKGGDGIQFVIEHEKLDFLSALESIAANAGITLNYQERHFTEKEKETVEASKQQEQVLNHVVPIFQKQLHNLPPNHSVKNYLKERGIDDDDIDQWGIGYAGPDFKQVTPSIISNNLYEAAIKIGVTATRDGKSYDTNRDRIMIPIQDENGRYAGLNGRYVGGEVPGKNIPKYKNSNECDLFQKKKIVFGLNHAKQSIRKAGIARIVEGPLDVISAHRIGQKNVVGINGTAFTQEQMLLLRKYTPAIELMLDNDDAGKDAFNRALPELIRHGFKVHIVQYDEKYKDPDSLIQANGKDAFKDLKIIDAIIYRANVLWENANNDPHEMGEAISGIAELLSFIESEPIRTAYADNIQKDLKIKNQALRKEIKTKIELIERDNLDKAKNSGKEKDDFKLIEEKNGRYYSRAKGGLKKISNFTLKVLFQVQTGSDKAFRYVKIESEHGAVKHILFDTDDFVSRGNFKKVIAREGNFVFNGSDDDLSNLQEILQNEETHSQLVEQMGWNGQFKFYAFSNAIACEENGMIKVLPFDCNGIVKYKDVHFFCPAHSEMFKHKDHMFLDEKKFVYREPRPNFQFKEWAMLFYKVYGDKAKVSILFYFASIFRDIIYKQELRFPMLNFYGPPQYGKGAKAESLLAMFGVKQDPLMLEAGSTMVGMQRKVSALVNAMVLLDEYKNSLDKRIIGSLKGLYDGTGRTTGVMSNDLQTKNTQPRSGIMIAGQDIPTVDPALLSRVVVVSFTEGKFTNEDRDNYGKLKDLENDGGFSDITVSLLKYRSLVESSFKEVFKKTKQEIFAAVTGEGIEDRMIVNISILLTMISILESEVELPFTYDEAKIYLIENMRYQYSILAGNDDVSKFWKIVENLAARRQILYDSDFFIRDGVLYIRLSRIHGLYVKELHQRGENYLSSESSLLNYLKLNKQTYIGHHKHRFPKDPGTSSTVACERFHFKYLNIELPEKSDNEVQFPDQYTYSENGHQSKEAIEETEDLPF